MPLTLTLRGKTHDLTRRALVMGIINVTPDSFSDGGQYLDPRAAVALARRMQAEGADILDVGGESTRPGSARVTAEEELRRVLPVIEGIRCECHLPISVDTYKAEVARAALSLGADMINDISGMTFDPRLAAVVAEAQVPLVVMHTSADPAVMQQHTGYRDVVAEIDDYFAERIIAARAAGIAVEQLILDPGIGFGKTVEQNLELIRAVDRFAHHGRPVLIGHSRKSFVGKILGPEAKSRLFGGLAVQCACYARGARIFRVHDVEATVQANRMLAALQG